MSLYGVPGMSLAVIEDGEFEWSAGYGLAAGDRDIPVSQTTLFQCCSISKMVSSLLALRLVALGVLNLDNDVNSWLVDWKLLDAEGEQRAVTLRQVLSHTGGINLYGAPGYPQGSVAPSLQDVLDGRPPAITAPVRVTAEPGRTYRYSGGGYCVLQKVIEIVTQGSFEQAAQRYVFEPLGMTSSTYAQPLPEKRWPDAAAAHLTLSNVPCAERWFVYPEQAVGGLWTTAVDLAQIILEMQHAIVGKGKLLTADLAGEMRTLHSENYNVGLGTYMSNVGQPSEYFSHTGAHLGWQAILVGYSHLGKGAIILTNNGYTGGELYREVLLSIAKEYEWPDFSL